MNWKLITLFIMILIVGTILFSFQHLKIEYTTFKACSLGKVNISEDYNFIERMNYVGNLCKSNCNFPRLLSGGVGENSQGFYCTYKSIF